jgi:ABC-type sugar transport system permease subunit
MNRRLGSARDLDRLDTHTAWLLMAPALAMIALVTLFPVGWTLWESLHRDDLRMPWLGRPFVGLQNYAEAATDPRLWSALGHTSFFIITSVALEVGCGLVLALVLDRQSRVRGPLRAAALLPWAMPTVVAALVWRFIFEGQTGLANTLLIDVGAIGAPIAWLTDAHAAWVPIVLADTWKTTPFVALLLLAGLQQIDPMLYEAARVDGAGAWRRFTTITWPLLRPALVVAVLFRVLDALRVFDLIFVLTAGGPGTATEPISLYSFSALLRNLRFGFGSSLSMIVFGIAFLGALGSIRLFGGSLVGDAE